MEGVDGTAVVHAHYEYDTGPSAREPAPLGCERRTVDVDDEARPGGVDPAMVARPRRQGVGNVETEVP
jgi:hypothetical protein